MKTIYRNIPGHPKYRAGTDGSIWSQKNNRWGVSSKWRQLKPGRCFAATSVVGYCRLLVSLERGKSYYVHHLILETFIGPRPADYEACHLDNDPCNNKACNLMWGTKKENGRQAALNGKHKGELHPLSKLTETDVRNIRKRVTNGETQESIARDFKMQRRNIGRIADGTRWGHVI